MFAGFRSEGVGGGALLAQVASTTASVVSGELCPHPLSPQQLPHRDPWVLLLNPLQFVFLPWGLGLEPTLSSAKSTFSHRASL